MKTPVVVIGMGEMGGVFSRGFLRAGHPVHPVLRSAPMAAAARVVPAPALVLVAVAENDLEPVLTGLPRAWRPHVGLLQNELLPGTWQRFRLDPTVIVAWFEKKPGQEPKVILPSPVYGPDASVACEALAAVDIPTRPLADPDALLHELVCKNLYILTSNIAGLKVDGSVGGLWKRHHDFARQVTEEVLDVQEYLTGRTLAREDLTAGMLEAFEADPDHRCRGRSAPARLRRILAHAEAAGLTVPTLHRLQSTLED